MNASKTAFAPTRPPLRTAHALKALRTVLAVVLLALAPALTGCTTNPATGSTMLSFMSPEEEKKLGAEHQPKLAAEFGGEIVDKEITSYVTALGEKLAKNSEMPNLDFTFTVLDTPTVNAFALPGGYVNVTRGLMAIANSEAELAGVIAHEIGHVTARHSAQRYSQNVLAGVGATVAAILTGSNEVGQLASQAGQLAVLSYSREDELEADTLGIRYLRRTGYDAGAMASFLSSLRAHSQLEAKLAGLPPEQVDEGSLLATHPRTIERVERASDAAGARAPGNPVTNREAYLRKIDGMVYGDSPTQGFARGRDFLHPQLRLRFRAPEGFELRNQPERVVAQGPNGALIIFSGGQNAGRRGMLDYLVNDWGKGIRISNREEIKINGLAAATGTARVNTNAGARDLRLVAIAGDGERVWRFALLTATSETSNLSGPMRETAYSFEKVSAEVAQQWKPRRITLHRVAAGDTVAGLAARLPFEKFKEEHFRVINGLGANEGLRLGQFVKLVTEE